MDIEEKLATGVRALRAARGLTLEQLADRSGVSRSTISAIERRETSPTAAVLDRLAGAFGVSMSALFAETDVGTDAATVPRPGHPPIARRAEQPVWKDPGSGYVRRQVSPGGTQHPTALVEVTFPPGRTVAFEGVARHTVTHQLVWVLDGEMEVTLDGSTWALGTGDCLSMTVGPHVVFRNRSRRAARYALAQTTEPHDPRSAR